MTYADLPAAASALLAGLVDGPPRPVTEAVRTRVSVHYETGDPAVPVLSVCAPDAVRLPGALVTPVLPPPGAALVGDGMLLVGGRRWRVTRWWRPDRPSGLTAPGDRPHCGPGGLSPAELVGRGPGLTPAGDDVLAGALVAAYATADPRLDRWRQETFALLDRTTVVSRALLRHAADGYATPELAGFVVAVCTGVGLPAATGRLLAVGHTSGAALADGVLHVLRQHRLEGAA